MTGFGLRGLGRAGFGSTGCDRADGRGRDAAIDVVRGLCIVSMTIAHLAPGGLAFTVTHAALWVDGAVGFVLLSGLVLGLVQRRLVERRGVGPAAVRTLRRAAVLYVAHLGICAVAFAVVAFDPGRSPTYPSVQDVGGAGTALRATLLLQVNPRLTSILSLYVVLLLLALLAVPALHRRAWAAVVIGSAALYVAGLRFPAAFNLANQPGVPGAVNWATWQLLFLLALVLGWHWTSAGVQRVVRSGPALAAAVVAVVAASAAAWLVTTGERDAWKSELAWFFTEGRLGPGTTALAFAFVLVLYRAAGAVTRRMRALDPVARIGRRSLDCYLILSVLVLVLPSAVRYAPESWSAAAIVGVVLAGMLGWCALRDRAERGALARAGRPGSQ